MIQQVVDESQSPHDSDKAEEVQNKTQMLEEEVVEVVVVEVNDATVKPDDPVGNATSPESLKILLPEAVVSISDAGRLSAELAKEPEPSPVHTAAKIAIAESAQTPRRSSLKLRHSLAGLRHSMTQESVRRASRRSMLTRRATRAGNSTCSTKVSDDSWVEDEEEMEKGNQEVVSETVSVDNTGPQKSQGTPETKERNNLEALKKKQEEKMRKMEEEKRRKREELVRKRDERLRRVFEAKVKEEQREEEKKKKIDKRMAEEKAKKKAEEKARKALKRKREQKRERERELERERQAAAERERVEKEKALALQREVERAAREKEMRELKEKRKALEEKRKLTKGRNKLEALKKKQEQEEETGGT